MQRLVKEYLSEWKKQQRKRRRIGIAVMLLVVMVVGGVIGSLTQYGVALTGTPRCGIEEHTHDASCYTSAVTCGQEEDGGHQHTEACYTESTELTCGMEEGEDHQHGDGCYTTSSELTCGQEESAGHTHTDACYTEELTCGMEEHTHTDDCYIDTTADVEDASVWNEQYKDVEWKETWGENLVIAAQMQIGYKESSVNYIVSEDGSRKGYTRYGQFATDAEANAEDNPEGNTAGDAYRDWDAAFVNFCMYYAGLTSIEPKVFPENLKAADTTTWCEEFGKIREENGNYLAASEDHTPVPGDLVFSVRENEEREGQMGIVSSYNKETNEIKVIEGNSQNEVRENTYNANDEKIVSYLMMSEIEKDYKADGDATDEEDPGQDDADAEENPGQDDANAEEAPKEEDSKDSGKDSVSADERKEEEGKEQIEDTDEKSEEMSDGTEVADGQKEPENAEEAKDQDKKSDSTEVTDTPEKIEELDFTGSMSKEELEELPKNETGAVIWKDEQQGILESAGNLLKKAFEKLVPGAADPEENGINIEGSDAEEGKWSIDAYYVGEKDRYNVTKASDFSLKYQIEFHTSRGFKAGEIKIRVKEGLLQYRDAAGQNYVTPSQIAVPKENADGTPNTGNKSMPFNYRIVTEKEGTGADEKTVNYLEFYNYMDISAGTNIAWQVLYKNLQLMEITDGQKWTLEPKVTVTKQETEKDADGNDKIVWAETNVTNQTIAKLTGTADSSAELTSISKTPYKAYNRQYTPGLYTASQVRTYAGAVKDGFINKAPDGTETLNENYRYVVWEVIARGKASQPWNLKLDEKLPDDAVVVGYKDNANQTQGYNVSIDEKQALETGAAITKSKEKSWKCRFYVVTAYPKGEDTEEEPTLTNKIQAFVEPFDKQDADSVKEASADWKYQSYKWKYNGDAIGMEKRNTGDKAEDEEHIYPGWLEVYKKISKYGDEQTGEDYGSIPFTSNGKYDDYSYTHYTDAKDPETLGNYRDGRAYELVTADDVMYARTDGASSDAAKSAMLGVEDYYYTGVTVTQKDYGYDVWEDRFDAPEDNGNEQGLEIYAMFAKGGNPNQWQYVATVPWNVDGTMSYSFSEADLAKEPWRVMARHVSTNYRTTCRIDVNVCIRAASPAMKKLIDNGTSEVWFEDVSGVLGRRTENINAESGNVKWEITEAVNADGSQFKGYDKGQYQAVNDEYEGKNRASLLEATKKSSFGAASDINLGSYTSDNIPVYRDNTYAVATGLEQTAAAVKDVTDSTSNADMGRGEVVYTLTAHDGYEIFSEAAVNDLKRSPEGKALSPGRKKVVFYDLLPYGMQFDPSYTVKAGRITNLDTKLNYTREPSLWNSSQVSVKWRTEKDWETQNADGTKTKTGRTMVIFEVEYDENAGDPAVYSNGQWMEGWGVSFRAYYNWKDSDLAQAETNICAFMPGEGETGSLCGKESEVAFDNGTIVPESLKDECKAFGVDINRDEVTDVRNVLYAQKTDVGGIAQSFQSGITKKVKADGDDYSAFKESAVAETDGGYTYEVRVEAASEEKRIVVYDLLEKLGSTQGTFQSIDVTGLESRGIEPVIYYSDDRNVDLTGICGKYQELSKAASTAEVFSTSLESEINALQSSKWYKGEEAFKKAHPGKGMDAVKAIIVDLSRKKTSDANGDEFVLSAGQSVSFQIRMKAPGSAVTDENAITNEVSFQRTSAKDSGEAYPAVTGDPTKVTVVESKKNLAVFKVFDGEVPDSVKDTTFEFTLKTGTDAYFDYKEYTLYRKEYGEWKKDKGQYATDDRGRLSLHADEVAVFKDVRGADDIQVTETRNIFWNDETVKNGELDAKIIKGENLDGEIVGVTVSNKYRPVLYLQKELSGIPEDLQKEAEKESFIFQIRTEDASGTERSLAQGSTFYYVKSVKTNGGIPTIDESKGNKGVGTIGENGTVEIKKGDIIAVFPGNAGTKYKVSELNAELSDGQKTWDNWVCSPETTTGVLNVKGSAATIRNSYRWKDLYLYKKVTHQKDSECHETFQFQLQKVEDGELKNLTEAEWKRITLSLQAPNADGKYETGAEPEAEIKAAEGTSGNGLLTKSPWTKDGICTFSAECAGKRIRLRGLEAGKTYQIKEIQTNSLYVAENDTVEITMPVYGNSDKATIVNDYQKRPLKVTKKVVSAGDPNTYKDQMFTMTVWMDKNGNGSYESNELLKNYPYTLMKDGKTVEDPERTNTGANGTVVLKDGETAVLEDAGTVGMDFKVVETPDENYPQLAPMKDEDNEGAYTGTFSKEGDAEAVFLNGESNSKSLYLSKSYVAADGDTGAESWVEEQKNLHKYNIRGNETVYVTLKARKAGISETEEVAIRINKLLEKCESEKTEIKYVDLLNNGETGIYSDQNEEGYIVLDPWKLVIIPENVLRAVLNDELAEGKKLDGNDSIAYTVTELETNQHWLDWHSTRQEGTKLIEINQKDPANDGSVEGVLQTSSYATITNEAKSYHMGSKFVKQMTNDSDPVQPGEKLAWRVERWDGKKWQPASGISYIRVAGAWNMQEAEQQEEIFTDDHVRTTGEDGKIELFMPTESVPPNYGMEILVRWPGVYFPENYDIRLNVYSGMQEGDLRVVEVMEESDPGWGMLTAYISNQSSQEWLPQGRTANSEVKLAGLDTLSAGFTGKGIGTSDKLSSQDGLTVKTAGGFLNSNKLLPVEISKEMEEDSEEEFTMVLKQVLSLDFGRDKDQTEDNFDRNRYITAAEGRPGIPYTVYDTKRGGSFEGVTGKNGEIVLKAGQYAVLNLASGTQWTVTEKVNEEYALKNLEERNDTSDPERLVRLKDDDGKEIDNLMLIRMKDGETGRKYRVRYFEYEAPSGTETSATYKLCGSEESSSTHYTVWDGTKKAGFTTPEKDGCELVGWSYTPMPWVLTPDTPPNNCISTGDTINLRGDVDLYAVWKEKPRIVKWCLSDGTKIKEALYNKGTTIEVSEEFPKHSVSDDKFLGWRDEEGYFYQKGDEVTVNQDMVFTEIEGTAVAFNAYNMLGKVKDADTKKIVKIQSDGSLKIPERIIDTDGSEKYVMSIAEYGFNQGGVGSVLQTLQLPLSVRKIETYAFGLCKNLQKVTGAKNVIEVGEFAFINCTALNSIDLLRVKKIGMQSFFYCEKMDTIGSLENCHEIGKTAFGYCKKLESIRLTNKITDIENTAFLKCTNLTVELPEKKKEYFKNQSSSNYPWGLNESQIIGY